MPETIIEPIIEKNKFVSFTYRILDASKTVIEQSDIPMEYYHGIDNAMFEKIENALAGKKTGDRIEVTLPSEDGFGQPDPDLIFTDDINNVPEEFRHLDARPMFQNDKGDTREMVVTKIKDNIITIDGNHPYAGKTVTFVIDIISIQDTPIPTINSGGNVSPGTLH